MADYVDKMMQGLDSSYDSVVEYDSDFDDLFGADDYDIRAAIRDGWTVAVWDGR